MSESNSFRLILIQCFFLTFNIEQNEDWLTNSSFQIVDASATAAVKSDGDAVEIIDTDDEVDESTCTQKRPSSPSAKKRSKKKKKKHRKEKRDKSNAKNTAASGTSADKESNIEFTGQEDYYVDKKPYYGDSATGTMDKRDVARYKIKVHLLGTLTQQQWRMMYESKKEKQKRYFVCNIGNDSDDEAARGNDTAGSSKNDDTKTSTAAAAASTKMYRMTEDEFIAKTKMFNKNLADDSSDIGTWLEFVRFQQHFYMKMSKVQLAERKMEILNRALYENPSNERLYREYVSILESAYPSFETSKFLDNLIQKGNYLKNIKRIGFVSDSLL